MMKDFGIAEGFFSEDTIAKKKERDKLVPEYIEIHKLVDFQEHPYQVKNNEEMKKLISSIQKNGLLEPVIVRPKGDEYEIISGHRRKMSCELAGLEEIPCVVRALDDDEATIIMVDSNLHRENLLPSEKAWAYRMKLEAMKRQGERSDLTCGPVGHKLKKEKSIDIVASESEDSRKQIQRFIRLTYLQLNLLTLVDDGKIPFRVAVEISYLKESTQDYLEGIILCEKLMPSLKQVTQLKALDKEKEVTVDDVLALLRKGKTPNKEVLSLEKYNKYFPQNYSKHQKEKIIKDLLENWQKENT